MNELTEFIKTHVNDINENNFTKVYEDANNQLNYVYYASKITSIVIPDSVKSIGYQAFDSCNSLTNIIIGKGVTEIGAFAFSNCPSLTSIIIPDSVKNIESYAFSKCKKLKNIIFEGTKSEWINVKEVGEMWLSEVIPGCIVHCIDGDIEV